MDYLYNKNYLHSSIKFFDVFTGNDILITGDRFVLIIDISVVELVADIPVVVDVVIEVVVAVVVNIVLDKLVIVVFLVLVVVSTFFIKIKII